MKAIILERRGDWAAVLLEDGTVVKTRQAGEVGDTIEYAGQVLAFPGSGGVSGGATRRWARTAIAAVLALIIAGGSATYYTTAMAASYVSVDVGDSSVELTVNRMGHVIAVTALNEGSEELAETLAAEVRNTSVDEAVDRTMLRLQEAGALDEGDDVIVGVTGENQRTGETLSQAVERGMEKTRERRGEDTNIYTLAGSRADRNEAMKRGQSPGKFLAESDFFRHGDGDDSDLSDIDPSVTPPAWVRDYAESHGWGGATPPPPPPAGSEGPDKTVTPPESAAPPETLGPTPPAEETPAASESPDDRPVVAPVTPAPVQTPPPAQPSQSRPGGEPPAQPSQTPPTQPPVETGRDDEPSPPPSQEQPGGETGPGLPPDSQEPGGELPPEAQPSQEQPGDPVQSEPPAPAESQPAPGQPPQESPEGTPPGDPAQSEPPAPADSGSPALGGETPPAQSAEPPAEPSQGETEPSPPPQPGHLEGPGRLSAPGGNR